MAKTVVVTGASGFVGRHLCPALEVQGWQVRRAARGAWPKSLPGADCVVHLAARVHVLQEHSADPLAEFRRDNVQASATLAEEAVVAGVRRLVFASSSRVFGPDSGARAFLESDPPDPAEAYDQSKLEAEHALHAVAAKSGLEVVVLRIPLVYGPGVGANFLQLMRAVDRRLPLPLASIENRRSLIYVGNLASALAECATQPAAAGRTFNVSDGDTVSTPELVRRLAAALGVAPRLFPLPLPLLQLAGRITGRAAAISRLCGSLELDDAAIRAVLGWRPPYSMAQGLAQTASWYREARRT